MIHPRLTKRFFHRSFFKLRLLSEITVDFGRHSTRERERDICRLNATEALVFFGSCGLLFKLARPALPCCCSAHNCIVDD